MSHYQHFEVENHLQYDKLCGARKASAKRPVRQSTRGRGEGTKDGLIIKPMAVADSRMSSRQKKNHF